MKSGIITKIKIIIFMFIISLIYFYGFDLWWFKYIWHVSFYEFLFLFIGFLYFLILSIILVFIYPYIKINSQSLVKRGLFFGLIVWIIDMPQLLTNLKQTILTFDIYGLFSFIKNPLYFIILGLVISFCYKKFLPVEFNLPLQKLKTPFVKVVLAIILTTLIYSSLMFFAGLLIFSKVIMHESLFRYVDITVFLHPLFYISPLIFSSIFILLYVKTIRRVNVSKIKKWIIFSFFISFFTTPLIFPSGEIIYSFFQQFPQAYNVLFIPHLISIFIIGYLLTKFFDSQRSTELL